LEAFCDGSFVGDPASGLFQDDQAIDRQRAAGFRMTPLHHHFEMQGWKESPTFFSDSGNSVCLVESLDT
jgi:UDP-N-acetylmuramyl pentapeptide phosphotransferase/UDP-N-acetylglucosamine-1-phosphate transferase